MSLRLMLGNALSAMLVNRRRTIVTVVSLAWAVASFLILISYGKGFDKSLRESFRAVGQDLVFMVGDQTSEQVGGLRAGRRIRLRKEDALEIKESVPFVGAISPEITMDAPVVYGNRQKEYYIRAVWPEYERVRNIHLVEGRWINSDDDRFARRVALVGATVARELFGNRPILGEEVRINGVSFAVIGQLETKVQLANYNRPDNECLFIPYETFKVFRSVRYPDNFVWMPVTGSVRDRAVKQVRATLAGIHRFSPSDEKALFILEFSKFVSIIDGMSIAINALLVFIGLVTLAIGAVGLANIMFTSVLERTREIGVMKALGARRRTILGQFLWEAIFVVFLGGACGTVLGVGITKAIGSLPFMGAFLGEELSRKYGRIVFDVSPEMVIVSFGTLCLVGLIAGMLPAIRASRLDPVSSLRYE